MKTTERVKPGADEWRASGAEFPPGVGATTAVGAIVDGVGAVNASGDWIGDGAGTRDSPGVGAEAPEDGDFGEVAGAPSGEVEGGEVGLFRTAKTTTISFWPFSQLVSLPLMK